MKVHKTIKRKYVICNEYYEVAPFVATGVWADGHIAYSRLDDKGNIIPEEEGIYYQIRSPKGLIMVRL